MNKRFFSIALLAILFTARLLATDGPISSSLPFFTQYRSVVPTACRDVKFDSKIGSSVITFTTRRGTRVLRQQWLPLSADGTQEVHNLIYDSQGRPRISEELHYTRGYNAVEIRSYRMDRSPIATRFTDGHGYASRITDSAGLEISETEYAALLRKALTMK